MEDGKNGFRMQDSGMFIHWGSILCADLGGMGPQQRTDSSEGNIPDFVWYSLKRR